MDTVPCEQCQVKDAEIEKLREQFARLQQHFRDTVDQLYEERS